MAFMPGSINIISCNEYRISCVKKQNYAILAVPMVLPPFQNVGFFFSPFMNIWVFDI